MSIKSDYDKKYREANKERISAAARDYYQKNKAKIKARSAAREVPRDKAREYAAKWRAKNRALCASYAAKYNTAKLRRSPAWLTDRQKAHILAYYECAAWATQLLGMRMEVDHVIPLQGENVSGLHVPWNLQVLAKKANAGKCNRVEAEDV